MALVAVPAIPAQAADGNVSGFVFRDFGADGAYDTGNAPGSGLPNDAPLSGVVVTAYDATGTAVGATQSAANGTYTLPVTNASTSSVRVEFTFSAAQAAEGYESSTHGPDNGTSVQFATIGDTDVDFGANVPEDYVQDNPEAFLAVHRAADPLSTGFPGSGPATNTAISSTVSLPWEKNGTVTNDPAIEVESTVNGQASTGEQTGSLFGLAAFRGTTDVYAASVLRRHIGIGEAGIGGIYRVDTVTGIAHPFLDDAAMATFGIDTGASALYALVPGVGTFNERRGLSNDPAIPTYDSVVYESVGHYGLGGLAASTDGSTLFAINLYSKSLLVISTDGAGTATGIEEIDLDLGADVIPWGISVHRDKVFIGLVNSAESSGLRSGLSASVISSPESDLATWSTALPAFALDFNRGYTSTGPGPNLSGDVASHWNAWTDDWSDAEASNFYGQEALSNPQPILSDITFDQNGNMILGFADRFSFQSGMLNYSPTPPSTTLYAGFVSGDVYGASPSGPGAWTIESNGYLGGQAGWGVGNGKGPGGGQYFNIESSVDPDSVSGLPSHNHTPLGAVASLPGFSNFLSTGYDLTGAWVSDAGWMPLAGTERTLAQRIVNNEGSSQTPEVTPGMGKAGGLGGIAVLLDFAPVELGNRVWFDADRDGTQDADEPPVAGVTVTLTDSNGNPVLDANGNPVGPVQTDPDGEYYFSNLVPNTDYQVHFTLPTSGNWIEDDPVFGTVAWTALDFTTQYEGPGTTDSDADPDGVAPVSLGGPGQNDHTIDAGLIADNQFTVQKLIDDAGGVPAPGQQFTINIQGLDFRGDAYTVSPSSVTIEADETSSPITVPVGTKVKLEETADETVSSVSYSGGVTADNGGYFLVADTTATLALVVTNVLCEPGRFSVAKDVTGDFTLEELSAMQITVSYSYTEAGGGSGSLILNQGNGFFETSEDIPFGVEVTIEETSITGAPASVDFGTPTWSQGDQQDGTAVIEIGDDTTTELTLTNPTTELTGTFDVTKDVTGDGEDRLPAGKEFTVQYSLDGGQTWTDLVLENGETVNGPADIPTGTVVQIREVAPVGPADIEWGTPVFSGTGVTPGSPATFTIGDDTEINVLLENPTEEQNGQFSITKDVTGPGENLLTAGTEFTVNYTYDGLTPTPGVLTVTNGQTASSPAIPTGTVVTITEVTPTGGLPTGAEWGTPTLVIDGEPAANGSTITIGADTTIAIQVLNPTTVTPSVEITKGDGEGTTIEHEAEDVPDGEVYLPGETRTIVIQVENTGPEPLREVALTDDTTAGDAIQSLVWTFPDGSTANAVWSSGTWTAYWQATFDPGTTSWAVGDVIYGSATLTVDGSDFPHQNYATVNARGLYSGTNVTDDNPYNAFSGDIQIIKYDGEKADPIVKIGDEWVIPTKPLPDALQDANTPELAVPYPADEPQKVRWVVTNTGATWLTNITLEDVTGDGPDIGDDWTADLSPFGGPSDYSFVDDGPWPGLFPPGASFFAEGTLTLPASDTHADTVTVVGTIVVPEANPETGVPTDEPSLDEEGNPIVALDDEGNPVTVTDNDPFHAKTPAPVISPDSPLAFTGNSVMTSAIAVGTLLLLGGAVLLIARRRRSPKH